MSCEVTKLYLFFLHLNSQRWPQPPNLFLSLGWKKVPHIQLLYYLWRLLPRKNQQHNTHQSSRKCLLQTKSRTVLINWRVLNYLPNPHCEEVPQLSKSHLDICLNKASSSDSWVSKQRKCSKEKIIIWQLSLLLFLNKMSGKNIFCINTPHFWTHNPIKIKNKQNCTWAHSHASLQ